MTSEKAQTIKAGKFEVLSGTSMDLPNQLGELAMKAEIQKANDYLVKQENDQIARTAMMQLSWIMTNFESILQMRRNVKPNNSPVLLFPNGKIRLPSMGTYRSIEDAYKALKRSSGDLSHETL